MGVSDHEKQRLDREKSRNDSVSAGEIKYKQLSVLLLSFVVTNLTNVLLVAGRN